MGTLQIVVLFLFLENHCKFEDENKEEDEPKASPGFNHTRYPVDRILRSVNTRLRLNQT